MHNEENLKGSVGTRADLQAVETDVTRQPELIRLLERFRDAVNTLDGLTCEVSQKLRDIKRYSEPAEEEADFSKELRPESFTEEMHDLISMVEKYNSRHEFNLRHLKEII